MKRLIHFLAVLAVMVTGLAACERQVATPSADQVQRAQQEQLSRQGSATVGMPAITNFNEKRFMKAILEARDKELKTVTYLVDMNGRYHKVCDSVGYGLPYATQYTNPQRIADYGTSGHYAWIALPQADPNGLFSPAAADGTWVLCLNPETKDLSPVFVEPRVVVSPFALS